MKSKILMLALIALPLLLAGCKSEAEKQLDNACSKDMSVGENEKACELALVTHCGGLLGAVALKDCTRSSEQEAKCKESIPSYCIENYKKAFR
ncbi:MAG: hypothetical protein HUK21_05260 [Fibrobacteraceae bacterium]|nr:hypothetical protein [Fibrobacteraceae bacterium]